MNLTTTAETDPSIAGPAATCALVATDDDRDLAPGISSCSSRHSHDTAPTSSSSSSLASLVHMERQHSEPMVLPSQVPPRESPALMLSKSTTTTTATTTTSRQRLHSGGSSLVGSTPTTTTISRRRPRNPRRFVVTELPIDADDLDGDDPLSSGHGGGGGHEDHEPVCRRPTSADGELREDLDPLPPPPSSTLCRRKGGPTEMRPGKTEVRGRFTIIDLSPESPQTTAAKSIDNPETADHEAAEPIARLRPASAMARRRVPPRRLSHSTSSMNTSGSGHSSIVPEPSVPPPLTSPLHRDGFSTRRHLIQRQQQHHHHHHHHPHHHPHHEPHPPPPITSAHRLELSGIDRHLEFLQQESTDMKALLESMISSNARWLEALASSGLGNGSRQQRVVYPSSALGTTAGAGDGGAGSPRGETLEDKYVALERAHAELGTRYEALLRQSTQLERNNQMLETRLQQETTLNDELRAYVDQLTQYTESLILSSEPTVSSAAEVEALATTAAYEPTDPRSPSPTHSATTDGDSGEHALSAAAAAVASLPMSVPTATCEALGADSESKSRPSNVGLWISTDTTLTTTSTAAAATVASVAVSSRYEHYGNQRCHDLHFDRRIRRSRHLQHQQHQQRSHSPPLELVGDPLESGGLSDAVGDHTGDESSVYSPRGDSWYERPSDWSITTGPEDNVDAGSVSSLSLSGTEPSKRDPVVAPESESNNQHEDAASRTRDSDEGDDEAQRDRPEQQPQQQPESPLRSPSGSSVASMDSSGDSNGRGSVPGRHRHHRKTPRRKDREGPESPERRSRRRSPPSSPPPPQATHRRLPSPLARVSPQMYFHQLHQLH